MKWFSVAERVPNNRRSVLAWGTTWRVGLRLSPPEGSFIGETRFNPSRSGGKWDTEEADNWWSSAYFRHRVTHWAEIEGPGKAEND